MLMSTPHCREVYLGDSHKMVGREEQVINIAWWLRLRSQVKFVFIGKCGAYKLSK